ncbi:MAG: CotH kinase family protein [Deltaproteobacteria bacterium]|nr:CotH kinase family protein [Deltaproteobacteria bacterium]
MIGIAFKGNIGSLETCFDEQDEPVCPKLDMKLKFNEYDKNLRFHGLKRLNFNTTRDDNSYLKEVLAYDVYREMGIVTPRTGFANVRVNGKSQGMYLLVEQVDGRFTSSRWPDDPDGNLYKEVWPIRLQNGESVAIDALDALSGLKTNEEDADVTQLLAVSNNLIASPEPQLLDTLDATMGIDYLMRYMAVDDLIGNVDGVTAWYRHDDAISVATNHNFYIYEKSNGQIVLIPWDLDNTLNIWKSFFSDVPGWRTAPDNCTQGYSAWNDYKTVLPSGCDRIFQTLRNNPERYAAAMQELMNGPFAQAAMQAKIDRYAARIRGAVAADPFGPGVTAFDVAVNGLKRNISLLRQRMECELDPKDIPLQLSVARVTDMEQLSTCSLFNGTDVLVSSSTFLEGRGTSATSSLDNSALRLDFVFSKEVWPWSSWFYYELYLAERPYNVKGLKGIRMKLKADKRRTVRLLLVVNKDDAVARSAVGWGWYIEATPNVSQVQVRFSDVALPDWAHSMGVEPAEALQEVLSGLNSIMLSPQCIGYDSNGFLPDHKTDPGFIEVDDIEFF